MSAVDNKCNVSMGNPDMQICLGLTTVFLLQCHKKNFSRIHCFTSVWYITKATKFKLILNLNINIF